MSLHFQHVRSQICALGRAALGHASARSRARWPGARPKDRDASAPGLIDWYSSLHGTCPGRGLRWACPRLRSSTAGFGSKVVQS